MKIIWLILIVIFCYACSSNIYVNADYSRDEIKKSSLAIVDVKSYSDLIKQHPDAISVLGADQIMVSIQFKNAIKRQSYFESVNYATLSKKNEFKLSAVSFKENTLNFLLPDSGKQVLFDSLKTDFVLFHYSIIDSTNYFSNYDTDIQVNPSGFIPFSEKFILNNVFFLIWDNNKGKIVSYGYWDQIWRDSYKSLVYEAARLVFIKSPFYKSMPLR